MSNHLRDLFGYLESEIDYSRGDLSFFSEFFSKSLGSTPFDQCSYFACLDVRRLDKMIRENRPVFQRFEENNFKTHFYKATQS